MVNRRQQTPAVSKICRGQDQPLAKARLLSIPREIDDRLVQGERRIRLPAAHGRAQAHFDLSKIMNNKLSDKPE
jgi:hypothetical protein